jgi:hypothetical protein
MDFSYLYIANNPAMPGLIKVGFTNRSPGDRVRELDTTGVPAPFNVVFVACVDNARDLEKRVHDALEKHRFRSGREFFAIAIEDAIRAVMESASQAGIEVYFKRVDETLVPPESVASTSGGAFFEFEAGRPRCHYGDPVHEEKKLSNRRGLISALETLDPRRIARAWKAMVEHHIFLELAETHRPVYAAYQTKMAVLGNIGIDSELEGHIDELTDRIASLASVGQGISWCFFEFFRQIFFVLHAPASAEKLAYNFLRTIKRADTAYLAAIMLMICGKTDASLSILQRSWKGLNNWVVYNPPTRKRRRDLLRDKKITEELIALLTYQITWQEKVDLMLRLSTETLYLGVSKGLIDRPPPDYVALLDSINSAAAEALVHASSDAPDDDLITNINRLAEWTKPSSAPDIIARLNLMRDCMDSRDFFASEQNFLEAFDEFPDYPCWISAFDE